MGFLKCDNLKMIPSKRAVGLAIRGSTLQSDGACIVDVTVLDNLYKGVKLLAMENLFVDVILGENFLSRHKTFKVHLGGCKPRLSITALSPLNTSPPRLFEHFERKLPPNCS